MTDPIDFAEDGRLLDAATPGPWTYDDGRTDGDERGKPAWIMTRHPMLLIACPDGSDNTRDCTPDLATMDANASAMVALRNHAAAYREAVLALAAVMVLSTREQEQDSFDRAHAALARFTNITEGQS